MPAHLFCDFVIFRASTSTILWKINFKTLLKSGMDEPKLPKTDLIHMQTPTKLLKLFKNEPIHFIFDFYDMYKLLCTVLNIWFIIC